MGTAEKGFDLVTDLWHTTHEVVRECPCEDRGPSCIHVSVNNGKRAVPKES